jgi:hypothetical protein
MAVIKRWVELASNDWNSVETHGSLPADFVMAFRAHVLGLYDPALGIGVTAVADEMFTMLPLSRPGIDAVSPTTSFGVCFCIALISSLVDRNVPR